MKRVWITGGGSGIGAALASSFASDGWAVAISGRDPKKLRHIAEQSERIEIYPCDITDPQAVNDCIQAVGPIDQAVLNAGTYEPGPVSKTSVSDLRAMMEVNYFGATHCVQALMPTMMEAGGRIALVGSLAGYRGLPNASGYGPSKAALISYAESLRAELSSSKVVVQLINPGFVKSELTAKNDFDMPYLIQPEEAANEIMRGLETDSFEIAFPTPFVRRLKLARLLPYRWYFPLIQRTTKA